MKAKKTQIKFYLRCGCSCIPPELLELFESNAEDSDAGHNNAWKLEAIKVTLKMKRIKSMVSPNWKKASMPTIEVILQWLILTGFDEEPKNRFLLRLGVSSQDESHTRPSFGKGSASGS